MKNRVGMFTTRKSEYQINNMSEPFNSELHELISFTTVKMIDDLRQQLMMRFHKRYTKGCLMQGKVTKDNKKNYLSWLMNQ